jgi:PKD repeat protein
LPFDKYLKTTNDTMVCPNSTVTMRILSGKGDIKWRSASNPNLILSQGDSLIIVCPDTPTRYEAISPYDTASIMVYPIKKTKASFSVILDGLTAHFINTSSNATSFQWDFGVNRSFDSNKNTKFKYWQPGPYYVRLIASNAKCLSDTFFKTVYVTGLSIIPLQNLNYQPYIYPNPFSNQINIELNKTYQKIDFQVYEPTGRILKQYIYKNQTSCILRLDDLPKGTYYLKIKTEEKSYVYKLQKE